jgi:hypothetical protein
VYGRNAIRTGQDSVTNVSGTLPSMRKYFIRRKAIELVMKYLSRRSLVAVSSPVKSISPLSSAASISLHLYSFGSNGIPNSSVSQSHSSAVNPLISP